MSRAEWYASLVRESKGYKDFEALTDAAYKESNWAIAYDTVPWLFSPEVGAGLLLGFKDKSVIWLCVKKGVDYPSYRAENLGEKEQVWHMLTTIAVMATIAEDMKTTVPASALLPNAYAALLESFKEGDTLQ